MERYEGLKGRRELTNVVCSKSYADVARSKSKEAGVPGGNIGETRPQSDADAGSSAHEPGLNCFPELS